MQAIATKLPEVFILEPKVFGDARGFFFENFNQKTFAELTQKNYAFVQDNHSKSARNVLRGLHYQIKQAQGKLVRVIAGSVYDVVVDIRRGSPYFGQSIGVELSAENKRMLWVPPGFAHGFLVTSSEAEFLYKVTDYWAPEYERTILWNDPELAVEWPLQGETPILSGKDQAGVPLSMAEIYD